MNLKRTVTVAVATLSVLLAPGVAQAVPGEPGQCSGTGYCQPDTTDPNLDGAGVVVRPPSLGEQLRQTLAQALVDIWDGPTW